MPVPEVRAHVVDVVDVADGAADGRPGHLALGVVLAVLGPRNVMN